MDVLLGFKLYIMMRLGQLEIIDNVKDAVDLQVAAIRRAASDNRPMEILEAGCGRSWPFDLSDVTYRLTGMDLDADALKYRMDVQKDLHEGLVGDLRTVAIDAESFDVIYCSFVLEHIRDAQAVLVRFVRWLRPGGSIIIKVPDSQSAHGFLTRISPHWFHVLYYRYIVGYREAGRPGHGPYVTYYPKVVSRAGLHAFCEQEKLSIDVEVGLADMARYGPWRDRALRFFRRTVYIMSFGAYSARHSNLLFIIRKPLAGD